MGIVLMDLSKAYDCLLHDLLIAKLAAYGFGTGSLNLFQGAIQCFYIVKPKLLSVDLDVLWEIFKQGDKQDPQTCSTPTKSTIMKPPSKSFYKETMSR